jgi:hypothetical protein
VLRGGLKSCMLLGRICYKYFLPLLPSHPIYLLANDETKVGSSDSPNISHDPQVLASDLAELADLLSKSSFRLAYENWCWATNSPTWSSVHEIIKLANRRNIGLCLDTFQTFGSEYADPRTESGLIEHAGISLQKFEKNFKDSLTRLTKEVDKDNIYLLQISDAYIPPSPLKDDEDGKEGGMRARGKWSHDFRPYPFNGGAFSAQCVEMVKAVLATGCREGTWFSVEVFDGGEKGEGKNVGMESFCRGAMGSYKRLLDECAGDS